MVKMCFPKEMIDFWTNIYFYLDKGRSGGLRPKYVQKHHAYLGLILGLVSKRMEMRYHSDSRDCIF